MALKYRRPYGTEDVTGENIEKWRKVESITEACAEEYGFKEIRIPTFETTDLFLRSVGETTDVVQKEMYTVVAKDTKFTLRPEGTAGTIRAMLQNGLLNEALPQKVFYKLSCFRHERPQAGRLREFHQFGVEMAGSKSAKADAEIISLAKTVLFQLGLQNIDLNINSIGCPACRKNYTDALRKYFTSKSDMLCDTCKERLEKNPMRILDCKNESCKEASKDAPLIIDYLCEECSRHFEKLKKYLEALDIKYTVNPRIVRGLDYYTKTVFEFVTNEIGAQGTVLGGGRYDGLIEELGGKPTPALGFGMGIERVILLMEKQNCTFDKSEMTDLYILPMGENAEVLAMKYANALRSEGGLIVQTDLMDRSFNAQMKYANKIKARFLLVLGDDELNLGRAKVKDMVTGEEIPIELNDKFVENYLAIQDECVFSAYDLQKDSKN